MSEKNVKELSLEYLLSESIKKKKINILLLIIGIILITISILLLIFDRSIFEILIFSILGSWLAGRFSIHPKNIKESQPYIPKRLPPKDYKIQEVSFTSFQKSRLNGAFSLITLSIFFLIIYGAGFEENQVGTWFTLNGFSLWYPLGVFPLAIGIGLLIYVIISTRKISISKTSDLFIIEEKSIIPIITEIPIRDVCAVELSNNYSGPKFLWIFTLGIQIVLLAIDGAHFLFNPFAFGYGILAGIAYLFTALYLFIVLVYLLFKHQTYLHIVTLEKRYELMFSLSHSKKDLIEQLEKMFGLQSDQNYQENLQISNNLRGIEKLKQSINIIAGIIFVLFSIISLIFRFYTGEIYRVLLMLFGIYLIIKGVKEDIVPSGKSIHLLKNQNQILLRKESRNWFYRILRVECKPDQLKISSKPMRLNSFDIGLMIILPGFAGLSVYGFFKFVPLSSIIWWEGVVNIIISIFLLAIIAYIDISPIPTIGIDTPALKTDLSMRSLLFIEQNKSKSLIKELKPYHHIVLIRLLTILISFSIGMVISMIA